MTSPGSLLAPPGTTLLTALRESLGLTAAKRGCSQGTCGTCTCLLDGEAVMSCLIPVETVDGAEVPQTLEGMAGPDGELDELQAAFLEGFATQCGFCTSEMIMAARALLAAEPDPTREGTSSARSRGTCAGAPATSRSSTRSWTRRRGAARGRRGAGGVTMTVQTERIDPSYFGADHAGDDFKVIGTPVQRSDALGHVTGRTEFFEDVNPPGLVHLKMHRSERDHALLRAVDFSAALEVPGVLRVLTHEDVPANWYTILRLIGVEPNVLAEDRVLPRRANRGGRRDE